MTIHPNQTYYLSPDGVHFLTCPNTEGGKVTLKALNPAYSSAVEAQIWDLQSDGKTINSVYITCTLGGEIFYLTADGTLNANLKVTKIKPTSIGWSIDNNGGITLNFADGNDPQFANMSAENPPKPIEADAILNWKFVTPYETINISDKFVLITDDLFLTGANKNDTPVQMLSTEDLLNSVWSISGTYSASKGLITNAQISSNGYYIYGLEEQSDVNCYQAKKSDYSWTIQDTGDQHASFICHNTSNNKSSGGLEFDKGTDSVKTTGPGTRKWKFKKVISNR